MTTYTALQGRGVTLPVEWLDYPGGPASTVSAVTVEIGPAEGGVAVVGPTAFGVTHVATGLDTYRWQVPPAQPAGDYLAIWRGTDAQGDQVTAVDIVTVVVVPAATGDRLATPQDLASLLQLDYPTLTAAQQATMALLTECATAVVQAAARGQRIVEVVNDTAVLTAGAGQWLSLPQYPVQSVSSVSYDGSLMAAGAAGYRLRGSRLFRKCGWSDDPLDMFEVSVVYTHGYPAGAQDLQLARGAVLGLTRDVYDNPTGLKAESVDDWSATYAAMSTHMDGTPALRNALRRQYGRRR